MSKEPPEGADGSGFPSGASGGGRDATRKLKTFGATRGNQDRLADAITRFAGSTVFVYVHVAWFVAWVLLNLGAFGSALIFDPFPYGLLTLAVSLEAIFLSTFVMISQNLSARRDAFRAERDFETDVRSEIWLQYIGESLGVDWKQVDKEEGKQLARMKISGDGRRSP